MCNLAYQLEHIAYILDDAALWVAANAHIMQAGRRGQKRAAGCQSPLNPEGLNPQPKIIRDICYAVAKKFIVTTKMNMTEGFYAPDLNMPWTITKSTLKILNIRKVQVFVSVRLHFIHTKHSFNFQVFLPLVRTITAARKISLRSREKLPMFGSCPSLPYQIFGQPKKLLSFWLPIVGVYIGKNELEWVKEPLTRQKTGNPPNKEAKILPQSSKHTLSTMEQENEVCCHTAGGVLVLILGYRGHKENIRPGCHARIQATV